MCSPGGGGRENWGWRGWGWGEAQTGLLFGQLPIHKAPEIGGGKKASVLGKFNYSNGRNSFWDLTKAAGRSEPPPATILTRSMGAVSHHHPGSPTATHSSYKAQDPGQSRRAGTQKTNLPNFPTIS